MPPTTEAPATTPKQPAPQIPQGELRYVPISAIRLNPVALRGAAKTDQRFTELVDSVRARGVLKPVLLRKKAGEDGKEFELVDGLQRLSASIEVGLEQIPAHIKSIEDSDAIISQVIGNAVSVETKPVEYAKGLMKILGYNPTWTEADLAAKINKSPQWISKMLGLLRLHETIKPLVDDGKITLVNAYALAKLPEDEQLSWLERAQTTDAGQFTQQVLERVKAIKEANRKGQDAGEEKFVPTYSFRKRPEVETEIKTQDNAKALITQLGLGTKAKSKDEAALQGFLLGVQWVGNMDPQSIQSREARFKEQKKKQADDKVRRDAEKARKREQEAAEKAKKASEEAAKAVAEAEKLKGK